MWAGRRLLTLLDWRGEERDRLWRFPYSLVDNNNNILYPAQLACCANKRTNQTEDRCHDTPASSCHALCPHPLRLRGPGILTICTCIASGGSHCRAHRPLVCQASDELSVTVGEILEVIEDSGDGWVLVARGSDRGLVPGNYCETIAEPASPAVPPPVPRPQEKSGVGPSRRRLALLRPAACARFTSPPTLRGLTLNSLSLVRCR